MQELLGPGDALIEIGTFLARRWSGRDNATIEFSERGGIRTRMSDARITLYPIEKLSGDGFEKYRQFRAYLWYESMRLRFCDKVLSSDHAFGFILNTLETKRIEHLGMKAWRGMGTELAFYRVYQQEYRPQLNSVYGRAKVVEGFYQQFLFGKFKGEISGRHAEKIARAARAAHVILDEAVSGDHGTSWLEKKVPEIIRMLDIDSLLTIPLALPWMKPQMALTEEELLKALTKVTRDAEGDFAKVDPSAAARGDALREEYRALAAESRKDDAHGVTAADVGVQVPSRTDVDESTIYDLDLINSLKTRFKSWKSGWSEENFSSGDEFDGEAYIEGHVPFLTDVKKVIKAEIAIMLDHSSSIAGDQVEYKKATLALCEVLGYLKVDFSVYAFSTVNKAVVCWMIKPGGQQWNSACAKRLAQVEANGSTPLAEVYGKMFPILQAKRPGIFLTLTDGEPADPGAVRSMIKGYRGLGIRMVALGLGPDTVRATTIASNLKHLGYERTLAVSRLGDIPGKVLGVLGAD
ncbi:conserved hypothetical protein [Cenarchaeum symbiosum A]|uniref:VWFA domain-containing protein n=1 Tax=Cenarchaeum symbiosum (strain A) TaxID=414004 RepID=A0RTS3_CENSY|nr:conserved hypothetical protein [Cenarchaeum symbiosum A]